MGEVRVPEEYSGSVIDMFNLRKGELQDMGLEDGSEGTSVIKYLIPTRGMLGLRSEMLSRDKGSLLAFEDGVVTSFGLEGAKDRGKLMVGSGTDVYKNMIVGIHQRPGDLAVNVCKTKALTNMRSATKGITTGITAPIELSLDA